MELALSRFPWADASWLLLTLQYGRMHIYVINLNLTEHIILTFILGISTHCHLSKLDLWYFWGGINPF